MNDRAVHMKPQHMVAGSPMRFEQGLVEIAPDVEWKHKMPPAQERLVTLLTWPLPLKYGYKLAE